MQSVSEEIEACWIACVAILDGKYGLSPEDKEVIKEAYIMGFDQGWQTCVRRSFENSPE